MKSAIIGTAGHIDHGKTALVKALTGIDTDRLPEEKERGITIDIGFAHAQFGDISVSFIDVPGHERFIKNMLAGIGGIDLLLLVVAADESVMPQTREHFEICRLLEISAGIVAITKKDLVDEETLQMVREDVAALVRGSFLENAPVHAVSAKTGEGLQQLQDGIIAQIREKQQRTSAGIFRLPIDRVFSLKGHGTVVTGTMIAGEVFKDRTVEILPSGLKARVRSIRAHNEIVELARAGQRTAVNLQGVEKHQIQRGDILTEPDFFRATSLLDVKITLLTGAKPLPHNSIVRFHHLTNDVFARVTLFGKEILQPGDNAFAQLRLQNPVFAVYGDRFILRKHSPLQTVGGGVILDHMPAKRAGAHDMKALERLKRLETADPSLRLAISVEQRGTQAAHEKYLKAKLAMLPEQIQQKMGKNVLLLQQKPLLLMHAGVFEQLQETLQKAVAQFHRDHPLLPGIPKEQLRTRILPKATSDLFDAVLQLAVANNKLQIQRDMVSLHGRTVELSDKEQDLATRSEQALLQGGLEFPGFGPMATRLGVSADAVRKMLYLLVRQAKAIKISEDYFLHKQHWEELKSRVRNLKASRKTLSVPDFKELYGISRKYAIPLLELLDREGITRRIGNERIIL